MVEPGSIRLMQGTAQPWVWSGSGWWRRELRDRYQRRRTRIRLQEIKDLSELNWRMRPPGPAVQPDITAHAAFYTPNQIQHIISWEAGLDSPGVATPPPDRRGPGWGWRPWPDAPNIWHKVESRPTGSAVPRDAPTGWWEGAGRGLPLGAALLAAILLLLRAADRCLNTNLFKLPIRRRHSVEWQTPNVMATSLGVRMTSDFSSTRPPSPTAAQCIEHVDLPPPYSECATDGSPVTDTRQKPEHEEPPPPYSACYVAYSNPKDGPPSVHFFTSQCQNLFANYEAGPSNVHDTGQATQGDLNPNSEERADRCSENDTMMENSVSDEVVEINNEGDNIENAVDSEVGIKDATSLARDRYLVV